MIAERHIEEALKKLGLLDPIKIVFLIKDVSSVAKLQRGGHLAALDGARPLGYGRDHARFLRKDRYEAIRFLDVCRSNDKSRNRRQHQLSSL